MSENTSPQPPKRRGLGRGLDALFEDTELRPNTAADTTRAPVPQGIGRVMMNITKLRPGKFQPRLHFNDDSIHALAQSIAQHGIIQPLLVRPIADEPGMFEIIAGERRWRAAQKVQLHDVPVVINEHLNDRDALQVALIENLQREDLNPFDEAAGYKRLMDEFHFTPDRLGEQIGKSRSHIVNMTRLLQLPDDIRAMVVKGDLSPGHARALIGHPRASELALQVVADGLSVRALEKLVSDHSAALGKKLKESPFKPTPGAENDKDIHIMMLERELTDVTGFKVTIDMKNTHKGAMIIEFKNLDQLDDIIARVKSRGKPAEQH
jgi:ParB family transcriptional regulator, chromosome partitioning protein